LRAFHVLAFVILVRKRVVAILGQRA